MRKEKDTVAASSSVSVLGLRNAQATGDTVCCTKVLVNKISKLCRGCKLGMAI